MRQHTAPTPTTHTRRRLGARLLLGVACVLAIAAVPACSSSDDDTSAETTAAPSEEATTTTVAADDPESAYCDTARAVAVRELDGDHTDDPAAFEADWSDYLDFLDSELTQAPEVLQEAQAINNEAIHETLTPIFEKYDYDLVRIDAEGTEEEKALVNDPPADVREAQTTIDAYESRVCGTAKPAPSDETFEADPAADAYCAAVVETQDAFDQVAEGGFDPADVEALVTGDAVDLLAAQNENVTDEIAADSNAVNEWSVNQFTDALAAHDFDIREVILDGTPEERAALQFTDPAIAEHSARVDAYDSQVCGVD